MTFEDFWADYIVHRIPGDSTKALARLAYEAGRKEAEFESQKKIDLLLENFVLDEDSDLLSIL